LLREAGHAVASALDKHLNAYAVIDPEGRIVTVGHRYRRIRRH
jgi:hypothetical protein